MDVCRGLEIANPSQAMSTLDEDERVTIYRGICQPDSISGIDINDRAQSMVFVFERMTPGAGPRRRGRGEDVDGLPRSDIIAADVAASGAEAAFVSGAPRAAGTDLAASVPDGGEKAPLVAIL
ncbi:MAG: hypothetical protein LBT40_04660 [Deltaproteobacteria bacterium]|jgi:hypothetical protein|nr:hypothetical protein [Deltaproteobacteria bacterium]